MTSAIDQFTKSIVKDDAGRISSFRARNGSIWHVSYSPDGKIEKLESGVTTIKPSLAFSATHEPENFVMQDAADGYVGSVSLASTAIGGSRYRKTMIDYLAPTQIDVNAANQMLVNSRSDSAKASAIRCPEMVAGCDADRQMDMDACDMVFQGELLEAVALGSVVAMVVGPLGGIVYTFAYSQMALGHKRGCQARAWNRWSACVNSC